ncbi:hypothetical protein KX928_19410 [Roseobacter sp. YSTF-M11]|uniref:Uncharacterized protein n=1 Tax=Roseobacter insulae TaxID=2859783 RepID=A0A9X1FYG5_9RHOB|nr:hypothetical protein [Roseobacter insulae]MBW4709957.1 hypothetical protein [Roseobacter insulae]
MTLKNSKVETEAQATPAKKAVLTHLGSASELTRGGFYHDEDNDGVRKTK